MHIMRMKRNKPFDNKYTSYCGREGERGYSILPFPFRVRFVMAKELKLELELSIFQMNCTGPIN